MVATGIAQLLCSIAIASFCIGLLYGRGLVQPGYIAPRRLRRDAHTGLAPPGNVLVLLGVITHPSHSRRRRLLRDFARRSSRAHTRVRLEFVVGRDHFRDPPSPEEHKALDEEAARWDDLVYVAARENLPHVGKAAEKSAAWWSTAPLRVNAAVFCKTDDDSLVHLDHLHSVLNATIRSLTTGYFLLSYVRWRGWLSGGRLQACGGGWGGPSDALRQIEAPACDGAEGPFPQGTGTLTCLSAPLARHLARDSHFHAFQAVAHARNDFGTPCRTARECAAQPFATHMWHHEDAGISYNVWRTVVQLGLPMAIVHLPERGWIWPWFDPALRFAGESARAIVVHKVTPVQYEHVASVWNVSCSAPVVTVDCTQTCARWGWTRARTATRRDGDSLVTSTAPRRIVPDDEGFRCCFLRASKDFGHL